MKKHLALATLGLLVTAACSSSSSDSGTSGTGGSGTGGSSAGGGTSTTGGLGNGNGGSVSNGGGTTVTPATGPLLVQYEFDELEGKLAVDSSANKLDAPSRWTPKWGRGEGVNGSGAVLGNADFSIPLAALMTLDSEATLTMWIKEYAEEPDGKGLSGMFWFGALYGGDGDLPGAARSLGGRVNPQADANGTWLVFEAGTNGNDNSYRGVLIADPPKTEWQHWAMVTTMGGEIEVYRDGSLVSANSQDRGLAGTEYFNVGHGNHGYFRGWMDDFRLYNTALTASEITEVYNYTPDPSPAAPAGGAGGTGNAGGAGGAGGNN